MPCKIFDATRQIIAKSSIKHYNLSRLSCADRKVSIPSLNNSFAVRINHSQSFCRLQSVELATIQ